MLGRHIKRDLLPLKCNDGAAIINHLLQNPGHIEEAPCQTHIVERGVLRNLVAGDGINALSSLSKYIFARCMISSSVMIDLLYMDEINVNLYLHITKYLRDFQQSYVKTAGKREPAPAH